jgi:hypothetical protein
MNHAVSFIQPFPIGPLKRSLYLRDLAAHALFRDLLELGRIHPLAGPRNHLLPSGFECKLQIQADHALLEVAQTGAERPAIGRLDRFRGRHNRWPDEPYVVRNRQFEPGGPFRPTTRHLRETFQMHAIRDIVEVERVERPFADCRVSAVLWHGCSQHTYFLCLLLGAILLNPFDGLAHLSIRERSRF